MKTPRLTQKILIEFWQTTRNLPNVNFLPGKYMPNLSIPYENELGEIHYFDGEKVFRRFKDIGWINENNCVTRAGYMEQL